MRFVTLFPLGSNIHLIKDVGQIPYTLKKEYGVEAVFASGNVNTEGPYINEVPGLIHDRVRFIWMGQRMSGLLYLMKNAKKIDWLNIYHAGKKSLYWARLYKQINPNGKVYLKLDMDFRGCKELDADAKARRLFDRCLNAVDIVSVESSAVLKKIQRHTNKEIILVPNGYILDDEEPETFKKENLFLTVGRLGTKQKATEILLEAFAMCAENQNWKLKLIGSVEADFKGYIEDFFNKYFKLKKRIEFTGVINDRKALTEEYRKAKIFVLPSRWEGFSLVLPEAASQGCKMILASSIPPCMDFVSEARFGKIVPSDKVRHLADAMERLANSYEDNEDAYDIAMSARKKFSWKSICEKIYSRL